MEMRGVFLIPLVLALSACATTSKPIDLREISKLTPKSTGAALYLNLQSEKSTYTGNGCYLVLIELDGGKEFDVPFKQNGDLVFVELTPGAYETHQLVCGGGTWDLTPLQPSAPAFRILPGKISFLSGLTYMISENHLSTEIDKASKDREEILKFFSRLPAHSLDRVVSGYSGKPLTVATSSIRLREWQAKPDTKAWPEFDACYDAEKKVNPLWLGELEVTATYKKTSFVSSSFGKGWHTLTNQFQACVLSVLKAFRTDHDNTVTFSLYL